MANVAMATIIFSLLSKYHCGNHVYIESCFLSYWEKL